MDLNKVASHCPGCLAEYRAGFHRCSDGGWYSDIVPEFAPRRVWVPQSRMEEAQEIAGRTATGEDAI